MTHPVDNPAVERAIRRACYLLTQHLLHVFGTALVGELVDFEREEGGERKKRRGR